MSLDACYCIFKLYSILISENTDFPVEKVTNFSLTRPFPIQKEEAACLGVVTETIQIEIQI